MSEKNGTGVMPIEIVLKRYKNNTSIVEVLEEAVGQEVISDVLRFGSRYHLAKGHLERRRYSVKFEAEVDPENVEEKWALGSVETSKSNTLIYLNK